MNGTTPAGRAANPTASASERAPFGTGPGLARLLEGGHRTATPALPRSRPGRFKLLTGTLLLADGALVTLAGWMVFGRAQPLGLVEALLCTLALSLGAWLGCCALWWRGAGPD